MQVQLGFQIATRHFFFSVASLNHAQNLNLTFFSIESCVIAPELTG